MKLEIHERLALLNLLPTESTYAALKDLRIHRETLSPTPEEIKYINLRQEGTRVEWDTQKAIDIIPDIPISEYTTNIVRDILTKMNKEGKLNEQLVSLYEKFVVDYR